MTHQKLPCFLAAAAALLGALPGSALAQGIELETIFVEGTGLDSTPVATASTGTAVTVVTGEELQQMQIRNAAEALRSLPGVSVSRTGGAAGLSEVRIRGGESNHTLVLIDGVEANAPLQGLFNFALLTTDNIERIEVIRGPQSGLYGSNALSGVINIVTRDGRGPAQVSIVSEGGSFATFGSAATVSGGNDQAHGSLTAYARRTGGFNIAPLGDEDDGAENRGIHFKGGVAVLPNLEVDMVLRHDRLDGESDNEGGEPGMFATQVDTLTEFTERFTMGGVEATLETLGGAWTHKVRANGSQNIREDTDRSEFMLPFARNDSESGKLQYLSTVRKDAPGFLDSSHRLTALLEASTERFTPVTEDNITRSRNAESAALDYHGEFAKRMTLQAAVRHDDNDTMPDFTTYKVAGTLALAPVPLRLHASVGTGVRLPTMFEQFGTIPDLYTPNPDLTAETSFGWDAGAEWTIAGTRAVLDVTYFEANLEDKITTVFLPDFNSTAVNLAGESTRQGVEVSLKVPLAQRWIFGAAYTHLDAFEPDGARERRRPEHSARTDLTYRFADGRADVTVSTIFNGKSEDLAFLLPDFEPVRVTLDPYMLVNVAANYRMREGLELFARVENLFDEDYQEVYGFETAGIAAYGGMRVRFAAGDMER